MSRDMKPRRKQPARKKSSGGTLVGMFIGLVIGVVAAAGVVWYLNKSPLPFVEKAQPPARADAARRLRAEDGGGIEAGDDLAKLKQGYVDLKEKDEAARRVMRSVGEKTFYRDGEAWVDAGFDPAKVTVVEVAAFSDAYWQLLADHPGAGKYLALGARVTVVLAGKAYRVAP